MSSILVVEDDPLFRETVVNLLSMRGFEVEQASDGEQALQQISNRPFDLLVSDIRIGGSMDGVEVLKRIRETQPDIRCILMTGFSDSEAPLRATKLEADDYLLKPFKLQVLLQSVRSVLEHRDEPPRRTLRVRPDASEGGWFCDQALQQLERYRERSLQQYFVLVRSKRLRPAEAYNFFCHWEQLELNYLSHPDTEYWPQHMAAYHQWEKHVSQLEARPLQSARPSIARPLFDLLYARIQAGVLQLPQLLSAIRLLHDPKARLENLEAYCTYHWLWSAQLDQGDPFLGLSIKGYRLLRHRSVASPFVRLYEAEAEVRPKIGDLVLCLPISDDWRPLMDSEIQSERASFLESQYDHNFLLYPSYSMSLKTRLPAEGVDYRQAWRILRPVFSQVASYHHQGRCSGCFALRDIDSPPGQPCSLSQFSSAAYCEAHRLLCEADGLVTDFRAAPEVWKLPKPTPASDQAVLGRILYEVIHGGRYPEPSLPLHIRMLGQSESNRAFAPHLGRLGPLNQVFYRMAHNDPGMRFPDLDQVIQAIDAAVFNRTPAEH